MIVLSEEIPLQCKSGLKKNICANDQFGRVSFITIKKNDIGPDLESKVYSLVF